MARIWIALQILKLKNKILSPIQFGLFIKNKKQMKKIILSVALLVSMATFAQKDELKNLKKLYAKDALTTEEFNQFKEILLRLEGIATTEEDKTSVTFYKAMSPLLELSTFGQQPTPSQVAKVMNPTTLKNLVQGLKSTLDFEAKSGKKVYTDDIKETLTWFTPMLQQSAGMLNSMKKFKEAGELFYSIYQLDNTDVANLENAAILAVQAGDLAQGDKLYREIQSVGFSGTGLKKFQSTELEVAKILAAISLESKNFEQAKKDYANYIKLDPNDLEAQINEANCYYHTNDLTTYKSKITSILDKNPNNATLQYNVGFLMISDDAKIVDEINANLKDDKKYKELMSKRKDMFKAALPYFEKAYQLDVNNPDTKEILKLSYDILGMKDKAATIK